MYKAIITKIKNVRVHGNADKVLLATCHGNQVVVSLDTKEDDLGIFFDIDGQISHEFLHNNNLYRESERNKDPKENPGMFDNNGRVRAQKFRGEISSGFWIPINSLDFVFKSKNVDVFNRNSICQENFEFDTLCEIPICNKYVNQKTLNIANNVKKKQKPSKTSIMFKEHYDTEQLGRNVHRINFGDRIYISEKVHGTSQRIGYVTVERDLNWKEKLAKRFGIKIQETEWKYLSGSRRVVLEESKGIGFHDVSIRDKALKKFEGLLRKGETVFLEIVGYEPSGAAIMGSADLKLLKDKEFEKLYKNGNSTIMDWSYGCSKELGNCDFYVYRITMNNEDGHTMDYSWEDVKKRCDEMGIKHVPEICVTSLDDVKQRMLLDSSGKYMSRNEEGNFYISDDKVREVFLEEVNELTKGPSLIDKRHFKEGICVRIDTSVFEPKVFKLKAFEFKLVEGLIKDSGVLDMEESS